MAQHKKKLVLQIENIRPRVARETKEFLINICVKIVNRIKQNMI